MTPTNTLKPVEPKDAHVLVVEDNLQSLVLVARLLAFIGIRHYEWKTSGWQILELADDLPRLDLVLMDVNTARDDSFDALTRLKKDPRFTHTKIIAVTADATPLTLERARQAGFDGFLGKPVDPDRFPTQIEAILRGEAVWDNNH